MDKKALEKHRKELFQQSLASIANEARYGFALHHEENYLLIERLFITFMSHPLIFESMDQLRKHDEYSFFHSIDTFILGALFAKKMNLNNIEAFALSCLLHDIGKLDIPQKLLQKKGMLTTKEYTAIQKHVLYGYSWLKKNNFSNIICELAQHHHERCDGTGYPQQLTKNQLSEELQLLMIIDVYSALTLSRPYRKEKTAIEAIKVFIKEDEKFNSHLVYRFLEMLKIFPPTSTVILSDDKKAKILYVNEKQPHLPLIEIAETKETLQLPINYSIYINNLIQLGENKEKQQATWDHFISALINGQKNRAIQLFDELIDNKRLEDIYINIIAKAMAKIGDGWEKGRISIAEEHIASFLMREILDYFKYKSIPLSTEKRPKIVTVTVDGELHTLPLKIAADLLEAKGWEVFNLEKPLPIVDLIHFLEKNNIDKLGISITIDQVIPKLNQMITDIKRVNKNITIIVGGACAPSDKIKNADIIVTDIEKFDQMFNHE